MALGIVTLEVLLHIFRINSWLPDFVIGVIPRTTEGLAGILFAPWLHGSWTHLFSNSAPLFLSVWGTSYLYHRIRFPVLIMSMLAPGVVVWFWDDPSMHLGASGWVYALLAFIFWSGLFRRHPRSIALSLIIVFLYGGMIWRILPLEEGISWQSHLAGAIAGFLLAFAYRKTPIQEELEDSDEDFDEFEEDAPDDGWKRSEWWSS